MSRRNLAWLLGVPGVIILGLTIAYSAPFRTHDLNYQLVRTVVNVLAEVEQHYVKKLTPEQRKQLVEDMINGGLTRLDPYSGYFNADAYRQFETQSEGNFSGVGIQINIDHGTGLPLVVSPMVGTPAYEAGILAGDLILEVDGQSTENMSMSELIRAIMGEEGTEVTLTVVHEGDKQPAKIAITRGKIEVESVLGWERYTNDPSRWDYYLDHDANIAYIRLVAFNEHTADDLRKALLQLQKQGVQGLILDLRDNPGGLLTQAIEVSDLFLDQGEIVSTRDRNGRGRSWSASEGDTLLKPAGQHPMVVLINRNSASAAEIVAAALQDHQRVAVVGERSFGKGSVQRVIELPGLGDGAAALKLTTNTYWRPSGKNIHRLPDAGESDEWGVSPNPEMTVKLTPEERLAYLRYRRAKDVVAGKGGKQADDEAAQLAEDFEDKILQKGLAVVREKLKATK